MAAAGAADQRGAVGHQRSLAGRNAGHGRGRTEAAERAPADRQQGQQQTGGRRQERRLERQGQQVGPPSPAG
jgi:hypothetical protein